MLIILGVFAILIAYDIKRFIKQKESAKVYIVYGLIMGVSLIISLFIAAGKRPASPADWIEWMLKLIGVIS